MGLLEDAQGLEENKSGNKWKPNPGDALAGTVVRLDRVKTKFGEQLLCQVRTDAGDLVDIWASTVLDRLLTEKAVQVGDGLGVRYFGTPQGKRYKNYSIVVEKVGF
jgi:hypothetical protein